jgi:hypothetical protein
MSLPATVAVLRLVVANGTLGGAKSYIHGKKDSRMSNGPLDISTTKDGGRRMSSDWFCASVALIVVGARPHEQVLTGP